MTRPAMTCLMASYSFLLIAAAGCQTATPSGLAGEDPGAAPVATAPPVTEPAAMNSTDAGNSSPVPRHPPATQPMAFDPLLAAVADVPRPPPPAGKPGFDDKGCQPGDQLPAVPLTLLLKPKTPEELKSDELARRFGVYVGGGEDRGHSLQALPYNREPTLILTSSLTCPQSRKTYPSAAELASQFENKIHTVVVYIVEAHPAEDPSPYSGEVDLTLQNEKDNILCRQPRNLDQRLELAARFRDLLKIEVPIYVDQMDNAAWQMLGGGPNMGILIDPDGRVLYRQGWFDPRLMHQAVDRVIEAQKAEEDNEATERAARTKLPIDGWELLVPFRDGDMAKVRELLADHPIIATQRLPSMKGISEETLLMIAAEAGRLEVAKLLIEAGADVNAHGVGQDTALHLAAAKGHLQIVQLLIERGADVNARPFAKGPTPIQEALINGHQDCVDVLRKAGAETNLFVEVATGDQAGVAERLSADPTFIRRTDGRGRTPIAYAAAAGRHDMVEFLIGRGARDEIGDYGESLAIHWAIERKDMPLVRMLLERGASSASARSYRMSLVHRALATGDMALAELLRDHGADLNADDSSGAAPIHDAVNKSDLKRIQWLYEAGASMDTIQGPDRDPCGPGRTEFYRPLHMAVQSNKVELIRKLVEYKANVNAVDENGNTPLHSALSNEQRVEMVRLLLDLGADPNVENLEGLAALDIAEQEPRADQKQLVDLIKARGGRNGSKIERHHEKRPGGLFG